MAKKRLTKQQQRRISEQINKRKQQANNTGNRVSGDDGHTGLVISHHGKTLIIEDSQGELHRCTTRQHIGQPVCGDNVVWTPTGENEGIISAILERSSLLVRPGFADKIKPVAANISLIGIVIAPRPEPQEKLIDSYLVAAEYLNIRPLLISNKTDLLNDSTFQDWQARFSIYQEIGYPWIMASAKQAHGVNELQEYLHDENCILVGQSGTGKSSLINLLIPDRQIKTGNLSVQIDKGQHTTSFSALYHLPGGTGSLIDSPGVRDFRLGHLDIRDIERGFIEFRPYLGSCRFSDCKHLNEPDCAIRAAVDEGKISPQRLERYFSILKEHGDSDQ